MIRNGATPALGPALALLLGCSDGLERSERLRQPVVYDQDDRGEYYAADAPVRALFAQSSVALVPNDDLRRGLSSIISAAPTWGVRDGICLGEAFAEQPAAAFCSGVLVDWDLVLTSGHCVRVLDVADFSVVFGYYYREAAAIAEGELAEGSGSIATVVEIVAEALDPAGVEPRLDYAWLRLAAPVDGRFRPAPIHARSPALRAGAPILTIGAPHGVPLKFDPAGVVEDPRAQEDFFVARTDTSAGWSGGGAYDSEHVLLGVLARGGEDLVDTDEGCNVVNRVSPEDAAAEQFTYAPRALEALCRTEPTRALCSPECGSPCRAGPRPSTKPAASERGCSLCDTVPRSGSFFATAWLLLAACVCRARRVRARVGRRVTCCG